MLFFRYLKENAENPARHDSSACHA
jgi:hypothetical protein